MVSYEEALRIILENCHPLSPRKVKLEDSYGLVLGEDIFSPEDIPPFDNSAMDGFAVRAEDISKATEENPVSLEIVQEIKAGMDKEAEVMRGKAIRIMTGAPIPFGADAVLRKEFTVLKNDSVLVLRPVKKGTDIRSKGEDIKAGDLVLKKGQVIKVGEIGILAALGIGEVLVHPPLKVAIITTGDELLGISENWFPEKSEILTLILSKPKLKMRGLCPFFFPGSLTTRKPLPKSSGKDWSAI